MDSLFTFLNYFLWIIFLEWVSWVKRHKSFSRYEWCCFPKCTNLQCHRNMQLNTKLYHFFSLSIPWCKTLPQDCSSSLITINTLCCFFLMKYLYVLWCKIYIHSFVLHVHLNDIFIKKWYWPLPEFMLLLCPVSCLSFCFVSFAFALCMIFNFRLSLMKIRKLAHVQHVLYLNASSSFRSQIKSFIFF